MGDEILHNYMGIIIISHYKDPYKPTRIQWKVIRVVEPSSTISSFSKISPPSLRVGIQRYGVNTLFHEPLRQIWMIRWTLATNTHIPWVQKMLRKQKVGPISLLVRWIFCFVFCWGDQGVGWEKQCLWRCHGSFERKRTWTWNPLCDLIESSRNTLNLKMTPHVCSIWSTDRLTEQRFRYNYIILNHTTNTTYKFTTWTEIIQRLYLHFIFSPPTKIISPFPWDNKKLFLRIPVTCPSLLQLWSKFPNLSSRQDFAHQSIELPNLPFPTEQSAGNEWISASGTFWSVFFPVEVGGAFLVVKHQVFFAWDLVEGTTKAMSHEFISARRFWKNRWILFWGWCLGSIWEVPKSF